MADYIPDDKDELVTWGLNFTTFLQANLIPLGLSLPQVTPVVNAFTAFQSAYNNQIIEENTAQAATQTANQAAANFDTQARTLAQQLQTSPSVSDSERAAMGLNVRDRTPTPAAAPTTRPTIEIGIGERLRHSINFRDEQTPDSKARPKNVRECEIWHKISETQPVSQNDYDYLAGDSATPYIAEYDSVNAGKTVWYLLRWKSTRGDFGPWSFPASAKIPG